MGKNKRMALKPRPLVFHTYFFPTHPAQRRQEAGSRLWEPEQSCPSCSPCVTLRGDRKAQGGVADPKGRTEMLGVHYLFESDLFIIISWCGLCFQIPRIPHSSVFISKDHIPAEARKTQYWVLPFRIINCCPCLLVKVSDC